MMRPPASFRDPGATRWLRLQLVLCILGPAFLFGLVAFEDRREVLREAHDNVTSTVAILREHAAKVMETDELVLSQVDQMIRGMSWAEIERSEALHLDLKRL